MKRHMKNIFRNILIIISILSFSSCDILDDDGSSISPLDSKVNFKVVESYDNYKTVSTPQIFIELQTEKIYGVTIIALEQIIVCKIKV